MINLFTSIFLLINIFLLDSPLENRISNIINKIPSSTKTSVYILDANSGNSIFEWNIGEAMIPASNTKLFTTAAALYQMGSKHQFTTNILTDSSELIDGVIEGNLYIKGFGHSTFNTNDLDTLISKIVKSGIKIIKGDIIADDSYFDKIYTRDDWIIDERANVNLPPVSALVINKNQFVISFYSSGKIGNKLRYSIKPECSFVNVKMEAKITKYRSRPRITSIMNDSLITVKVRGGLRKRKTPRRYVVNINNPPLYFSLLLKERLQMKGINVLGEARANAIPRNLTNLFSVGISLDSLIALINKNSNAKG